MLDHLYRQPLVDINAVVRALNISFPTANKLAAGFVERGILNEVTGHRRNRIFRYSPYLAMFDDSLAAPG
jgi:ribosomal protein S25